MSDSETTVAELRRLVDDFVDQRDWHQFHTPKNLAMSLAIEAAELMEHFQWLTAEQSRDRPAAASFGQWPTSWPTSLLRPGHGQRAGPGSVGVA